MSFEILEESRAKAAPIQLMLVRYGADEGAFYAFTTAANAIEFDGITYSPMAFAVPEITASGNLDKASLDIKIPTNSPITDLFQFPPSYTIALTLRQGHVEDSEFPVTWLGRILDCIHEGGESTINCEPVSTSLRRVGLRRPYGYGCPHALYGPKCKASLSAATISVTPEAIGETSIDLPAAWTTSDLVPKYLGGLARWQGSGGMESRSILRIESGVRLILSGPTRGLTGGEVVQVSFGCSHKAELVGGTLVSDCQDLHGNIQNYGGQLFIPLANPIGTKVNMYY